MKGGAQFVAGALCDSLTLLAWDCGVLEHTSWAQSTAPDGELFPTGEPTTMTPWRGGVARSVAPGEAQRILDCADLVLVVDRSVGTVRTAGAVVLLLSNLAYDNERQAARERCWDAVWVPSAYLAGELVAHYGWAPDRVHVVPPFLPAGACTPEDHGRVDRLRQELSATGVPHERRLLFPHRADPGKGLPRVLGLLRRLLIDDPRWTLIATAPSGYEGHGGRDLAAAVTALSSAQHLDRHLVWVPWLPTSEMACLYRSVGCTVMASSMPEGFALVPVESVAAGVPVVATRVGNLPCLATRFPSIRLLDEVDDDTGVTAVHAALAAGVPVSEQADVLASFGRDGQLASLRAGLSALAGAA